MVSLYSSYVLDARMDKCMQRAQKQQVRGIQGIILCSEYTPMINILTSTSYQTHMFQTVLPFNICFFPFPVLQT